MKQNSIKTRIIAGVLAVMTVFSASAFTTAHAAQISSADAKQVAEKVAETGLKDLIGKLADTNPAASIFKDMGFAAFDELTGKNSEDPNAKVLESIADLSANIDKYHQEEMDAIKEVSDKVNDTNYKTTLQTFNQNLNYTEIHYHSLMTALNNVDYAFKDAEKNNIPLKDENEVITEYAYQILQKYLFSSTCSFDRDELETELTTLNKGVCGKLDGLDVSAYKVFVDYDAELCSKNFSYDDTVTTAPNLNKSHDAIIAIGGELTTDYTAYYSYLQMLYEYDLYNATAQGNTSLINTINNTEYPGYLKQLRIDTQNAQNAYDEAATNLDQNTKAIVTADGVDYYYGSVAKAWSAAARTGALDQAKTITVKLNSDWIAEGSDLLMENLPNNCKYGPATNPYSSRTVVKNKDLSFIMEQDDTIDAKGKITYYYTCMPVYFSEQSNVGDITFDLNGHNIRSHGYFVGPLFHTDENTDGHLTLIDSQNKGTIVLCDDTGEGNSFITRNVYFYPPRSCYQTLEQFVSIYFEYNDFWKK